MNKSNVVEFSSRDAIVDPLSELLRAGAGQLIYQAVEAELNELLAEHSERRLADGKAGVVRNGYQKWTRILDTPLSEILMHVQAAKTGAA